ncbi:GntR family transcriptional regulator [Sulfidibacter corallicola]|uniref:GntR family transcriptional regulator n=1 Tax=Sulfidibacter corallicola TaxID=2818388 RepID=A0A8A4TBR3_SULCO|nr:GntR family transcriptional regulator [Sulfidibacter corallicola]QTD47559.1 GntR family transcriptional regulator [Sulfidibacter corallicola]
MQKQPSSLAEKAYSVIEEMIVTLKLAPGTIFSEAELSREINIGRTPLREALQRLTSERLVVTMPRRGMMVTEVNITEHLALLETRRVLDRLIATRAARRATPEHRAQLADLAANLAAAARTQHTAEFMRYDRECDQVLEDASRNPFAARACAPLHAHCRRFWYLYQGNGDLGQSATLHAKLMDTVAEGNEEAAAAASDQLMDYLEQFTRAALEMF